MKVILTGATGMVGEGVLMECLENTAVEKVLMINRKNFSLNHPKLEELIVPNFMDLSAHTAKLTGYDSCFYCAGISSLGLDEAKYTHITYDTTLSFAKQLLDLNPSLVFNFITGSHTDSSEKGKSMWARVKGKTENDLMKLPFKAQYNFRPGGMLPTKGQKNAKMLYVVIVKCMNLFVPSKIISFKELGNAMINAVLKGAPKQVLEISDIKVLARA